MTNIVIEDRIKDFPMTYKFWTGLAEKFNKTLNESPDIMSLPWNDEMIVENYEELMYIIPFACIFDLANVKKKIESSASLKVISDNWYISINDIETSIEKLAEKYKLPKEVIDFMLYITTVYIDMKVIWLILNIYKDLNPEIGKEFSFRIYFRNFKKRLRETAKNSERNMKFSLNLLKSVTEQSDYNRKHPAHRNGVNKFKENLNDQSLNADRLIDTIFFMNEKALQITMGEKKAQSFTRSTLFSQDCHEIIRMIPIDFIFENHSKREVYRDFYDYLLTFMKKEKGLVNEDEYNDDPDSTYDTYKDYSENKVKIIFGLTKS